MGSGDRNVVKEALADARALREAALDAAKQKLVEDLSPTIRNLVERTLGGTLSDDVDRLRRAKDGHGETEFEEGKDLEGDTKMAKDKEKDLEKESLNSMFPGISEVDDEMEGDPLAQEMGMGQMPGQNGQLPPPMMSKKPGEEDEGAGMSYEMGIPMLGAEGAEGDMDGDNGDMDEEITIDEDGLRKAYESVMKTVSALDEAQVSSGFKDSYPSSEWETEDSPPTDRGLEDKEKENAPWEKEKPKAAKDYQVKEAIEKGLRENAELRRYVGWLEEQNANAVALIRKLKEQITEVNLFNSKVVHVNEMFHRFGKNLTREQKTVVIKKIDEAATVREVKMVAEALKASFGATLKLNEGDQKRRPKADAGKMLTSGSPDQKVLRESVDKGPREQFARIRELAGIVGSKQ